MARILTAIHGFQGVKKPCGPWYSIFHGWQGIPIELVSNICYCSVVRKCVFMVCCSISGKII